ncbi:MAG: caspase family protein [Burkholderiaceae bacterium]
MAFPPVLSAVNIADLKPGAPSVRIPFTIRAKGQPRVEVRVDGRPREDAKIQLPSTFTGRERAIAELKSPPPGTVIQIIARDENGVSEPLGFKIATPAAAQPATVTAVPPVVDPITASPEALADALGEKTAQPAAPAATIAPPAPRAELRRPRLFVLAVGVSRYQLPEYQLGLADKDSRDFVDAVTAQRGRYYREVQSRVLTNQHATRDAISAGLEWLAREVGPDDVGMLFMAGHGVNAPDGQYYFMPYEGRHQQLGTTSVPEQEIRSTLGRMRGKALFFVDTCYAGNALGNFRTASRELAKLANNLAATENGVIVFASSSGRQLSEENDAWGNGAFTKALIEGLSGKADLTHSGQVTYKGLDYYVSDQVSRLTQGRQTPVTISPIGVPDFAIANVRQI